MMKLTARILFIALSVMAPLSMNAMQAFARDSATTRAGGLMYWDGYEYSFENNVALPENVWKKNVDWVASTLKPYGYNMVVTDGWIEGAQKTNPNGYILSYNDGWKHDWKYWVNYAAQKGLNMGVYYDPLWVTASTVKNRSKLVEGTKIPVADIVDKGDRFDSSLYWVDVTKPGAKQYIQGYVKYFENMGVKLLRIDFLSWYESGTASGAPAGAIAHGSKNYATALRWIEEAAGNKMTISLVMPNLYQHAKTEVKYGDMFRIDEDASTGGWAWLNYGSFGDYRQTWQGTWSQWANAFMGFTGFSDVAGRGSAILDGDFLQLNTFTGPYADNEKKSAISLFTMAGSPLAIADQYNTIGSNAHYYENQAILTIHKDGFVGKPVYYNGKPFEPTQYGFPSTGSRDPERWIGQTTSGNWVVALFNRGNAPAKKSIDFSTLLGLSKGGYVYDLWSHKNLGLKTSQTVTLLPHDVSMVEVTPVVSNPLINTYQASVATWRNGAQFNNNHRGYSGMGFVELDAKHVGANVLFAVNAPTAGTYNLTIRYANATGQASTATWMIQNANSVETSSAKVRLPNLANWNTWKSESQSVHLTTGLNYIEIARNADDAGSFDLNYIQLNNRNP